MNIVRFLNEHLATIIAGIIVAGIAGIAGIIFKKRSVIIDKLQIKIRNLGWKMKKILQQILGRRQTRAELLDLSQNIYSSLAAIQDILRLHHQDLKDLEEDINKPMTKEQKEAYYIAYNKLTKSLDKINRNRSSIEGRYWGGMYDKDGKIRKRI